MELKISVNRKLGTHKFYLNSKKKKVVDISRNKVQILSEVDNCWFHDKIAYDSHINKIIQSMKMNSKMEFDLFLKRYLIDFEKMKQKNIHRTRNTKNSIKGRANTEAICRTKNGDSGRKYEIGNRF